MKLNPIATAVNGQIAVIEFSAIERAAAEKLPLKQANRELTQKLQADLDAQLQVAVERFLGEPLVDPQIIMGRLTHFGTISVSEDGTKELGDTYCMDGVPVLWAGPVTVTREDDTVRGERQLRQLVGESQP